MLSASRTTSAADPALARYQLGNACAARGALEDAARAFTAALAARPHFPSAHHALGHVRLLQRRFADAVRCFSAVAAVDPAIPGLAYHTGVALQGLGDDRAAAAAFRRALEREPHFVPAHNNLCVALLRAGEPAAALEACERFLARAPASPKVLAYQAAAQLALGRRAAARSLLDFDRLIFQRDLAPPAALNDALAAAILAHPSLCFEPAGKSTRGGRQTGEFLSGAGISPQTARLPASAFSALSAVLHTTIRGYLSYVRAAAPEHPYIAHLPARWRLASWAVVLDAHGHQLPHFHPDGCVSGVYYVRVPDSILGHPAHAGWLEFGDSRAALSPATDLSIEPLRSLVQPRAGHLVLFPSYFYHRTLPFVADAPRISIAFDVLPVA